MKKQSEVRIRGMGAGVERRVNCAAFRSRKQRGARDAGGPPASEAASRSETAAAIPHANFTIVIAFISLLAAIAIGACAPGGGGMSGANPDDRTQEVWTDGTDTAGAGDLPGGGPAFGVDGDRGAGAGDDTRVPTPGGLGGGEIAYGIDGIREADDGVEALRPGGLPGPGSRLDGEIARGTDIGNPNQDESADIPVKEWSLCFERQGFLLLSPIAMSIRQLATRDAFQEAFVLTPFWRRDSVVLVRFFFPPFNPAELLIAPKERLEPKERLARWVRSQGLALTVASGPLPMMSGEIDGKLIIAATRSQPRYVLLRGDPDVVDEIRITTEKLLNTQGNLKPEGCSDGGGDVELLKDPPPEGHEGQTDMTIMKGLRDATKSRTMQLLAPPKK